MSLTSNDNSTMTLESLKENWKPKTKTGRLVKAGRISLNDLLIRKILIKEPEIMDFLTECSIKEEVIKVTSIGTGQYRFKAYVLVSSNDLIGLGKRCAGSSTDAVSGAAKNGRLRMFRIRKLGATVPANIVGNSGTVEVKIMPFVDNIIASPMIRKMLQFFGFGAAHVTCNSENQSAAAVVEAAFDALSKLAH